MSKFKSLGIVRYHRNILVDANSPTPRGITSSWNSGFVKALGKRPGDTANDTPPPKCAGRRALAMAAVFGMTLAGSAGAQEAGRATAISGDTIELAGTRYCLGGIDAPEPGQSCRLTTGKTYDCGRIATTALMDLVAGTVVQCKTAGVRADGCPIAQCAVEGFDLSANMVHTGWALADPTSGARYKSIQGKAKQARRGLWQGTFVPPWTWRQRRQQKSN